MTVLRSLMLICLLLVTAPVTAWAELAQQTAQAQTTVSTDETKVTQLSAQRTKTAQRYQDQLGAVDRLKKQKASWRRDRELRDSLADSADAANQLTTLDTQLAAAIRTLAQARQDLVAAIDREKPTATGARATQLDQLRTQVTAMLPNFGLAPKKIVLPDAEVDPLADPEELDQQAQAIAETEKQLANQVAGLDSQATDLAHIADLHKHHDRANEMMLNDDDQPHRNVQHSSGKEAGPADTLTPTGGTDTGGTGTQTGGGAGGTFNGASGSTFETEATFVLGEVIDHSTIDSLTRAQRSGDPAKRAEAARLARDAVSQRLDQLKKKRAQIEARAKQLRAKH
ncbi:MAG TPA: hypothetical protein VF403_28720 [Kofleriaceae bacterium]